MVTRSHALPAALSLIALGACTPEIDDRAALITGPTLLAIASTPAEAAPPAKVTLRALYVDQEGERSDGELDWGFCVARRAFTDQGTVSPVCLSPEGDGVLRLGKGASVEGALPMDGCRLFGPDRPAPMAGEPAGRPVDPDPSGGYYQPARLLVRDGGDRYAVGTTRLSCGVSGANAEVAAEYGARYRANESPAVASFSLVQGGSAEPVVDGTRVAPGAKVTLRASWAACPSTSVCGDGVCGIDETAMTCEGDCKAPRGCSGAEQYVRFDPETRTIVTKRESIRVSWFTTGGQMTDDVVGRAADQTQNDVENGWTAPTKAGPVRMWLVIRDDRGGIGWSEYVIDVGG